MKKVLYLFLFYTILLQPADHVDVPHEVDQELNHIKNPDTATLEQRIEQHYNERSDALRTKHKAENLAHQRQAKVLQEQGVSLDGEALEEHQKKVRAHQQEGERLKARQKNETSDLQADQKKWNQLKDLSDAVTEHGVSHSREFGTVHRDEVKQKFKRELMRIEDKMQAESPTLKGQESMADELKKYVQKANELKTLTAQATDPDSINELQSQIAEVQARLDHTQRMLSEYKINAPKIVDFMRTIIRDARSKVAELDDEISSTALTTAHSSSSSISDHELPEEIDNETASISSASSSSSASSLQTRDNNQMSSAFSSAVSSDAMSDTRSKPDDDQKKKSEPQPTTPHSTTSPVEKSWWRENVYEPILESGPDWDWLREWAHDKIFAETKEHWNTRQDFTNLLRDIPQAFNARIESILQDKSLLDGEKWDKVKKELTELNKLMEQYAAKAKSQNINISNELSEYKTYIKDMPSKLESRLTYFNKEVFTRRLPQTTWVNSYKPKAA